MEIVRRFLWCILFVVSMILFKQSFEDNIILFTLGSTGIACWLLWTWDLIQMKSPTKRYHIHMNGLSEEEIARVERIVKRDLGRDNSEDS